MPRSLRTRHLRAVLAIFVGVTLMSTAPSRAEAFPDSEASAHTGETATIEGVVKGTPVTVNRTQFLDFGDTYPNQDFSDAIWAPDAAQFKSMTSNYGKRVAVTGKITLYRGKPEMVLTSADKLQA